MGIQPVRCHTDPTAETKLLFCSSKLICFAISVWSTYQNFLDAPFPALSSFLLSLWTLQVISDMRHRRRLASHTTDCCKWVSTCRGGDVVKLVLAIKLSQVGAEDCRQPVKPSSDVINGVHHEVAWHLLGKQFQKCGSCSGRYGEVSFGEEGFG